MDKPTYTFKIICLAFFALGTISGIAKDQGSSIQKKFIEWQMAPYSKVTSTSTVGFPRESKISRPTILSINIVFCF